MQEGVDAARSPEPGTHPEPEHNHHLKPEHTVAVYSEQHQYIFFANPQTASKAISLTLRNKLGGVSLPDREITRSGKTVALGPTEFRLLHFLMTHPERVHSRAQLLDQVWGDHVFVEERTVDVHIRRLRCALEPSLHDGLVQTVRGSGYRFSTQQESPAVAR